MSKALEMVRTMINGANEYEKKTGDKNPSVYFSKDNLLIIEQALQRLESIDNANPSEALECLDSMYARLPQWDLCRNLDQYNTIKQALLKAQESKHYIKWEDLEFDYGVWKNVEVVLNGTKYTLNCYKNCSECTYVKIYLNGIIVADLCSTYKADKQFFNDLHLERV